jgi:hypothetical protein
LGSGAFAAGLTAFAGFFIVFAISEFLHLGQHSAEVSMCKRVSSVSQIYQIFNSHLLFSPIISRTSDIVPLSTRPGPLAALFHHPSEVYLTLH